MKRILLATVVSLSFTSLAYAGENNGFYTSIKSGVSDTQFDDYKLNADLALEGFSETFEHKDSDDSIYPNITVAVGFDFAAISPVTARAELEYTYKDKMSFNPDFTSVTLTDGIDSETIAIPEGIPGIFTNELRTQSLMLNSYYDFKNSSKFTPYVSAGVGVTRVKYKQLFNGDMGGALNNSDTNNNFTWSAGAGVAYKVTNNVHLDLGYRYIDADEVEFSQTFEDINLKSTADLTSHDYSLGIRYNF